MLAHEPAWADLHRRTGVLHLATTPQQAERMAAILATHAFPEDYLRWVDANEAAQRAQCRVAGPGWWIADGGWARPQPLCRALLGRFPHRIRTRFGTEVHDLAQSPSGWRVLDAGGKTIGEAPVLVLANGYDARRFGLPGMPRLVAVRGQVSFLPPATNRMLDIVVGGDGYVAPLPGGGHLIASTFEPDVQARDVRTADHASNLERAERMLPEFTTGVDATRLTGWAGVRAATADRLPACGALDTGADPHGNPACYLVTGLGARGLIWAPLCAEVLASRLEHEPNPVERSLVDAMDPLRESRMNR
jgi:tRNA 5-methylaminomethyl-2-thiouridine biosynthesis bifunctional protein